MAYAISQSKYRNPIEMRAKSQNNRIKKKNQIHFSQQSRH